MIYFSECKMISRLFTVVGPLKAIWHIGSDNDVIINNLIGPSLKKGKEKTNSYIKYPFFQSSFNFSTNFLKAK